MCSKIFLYTFSLLRQRRRFRHPFYFTNFATLGRQFLVHALKTLLRDTRQLKWNNFKMKFAAKPKKRTS